MIVYCEIMTYIGTAVSWAEHWYANLVCDRGPGKSCDRRELKQTLTDSGAARMTRREDDGTTWEAGEETNKFFEEEDVRREAIRQYKLLFPDATILVDGRHGVCDPQPVLDGPADVMETANWFVEQANAAGWWEGDEDAMQIICDNWDGFWEGVKCTH